MTTLLLLLPLFLLAAGHFLSPASAAPSSHSNEYKYRCDWCPRHATASLPPPHHYVRSLQAGTGSCGYGGVMGVDELPGGAIFHHAAATAGFFRRDGGAGCGACYQLRCRDRALCGDDGVRVVVTDVATREDAKNRTGFVLTREGFAAMARNGMADRLGSLLDNVLQVDFRRVPCEYEKNLSVRVEAGSSNDPGHLTIRFFYQGGQTDIAAVEIAQADHGGGPARGVQWRSMAPIIRRRGHHGAWRTSSAAPAGPLRLRLVVTAGSGGKWLRSPAAVLPADWRAGGVYDTGLRVTDVAVRSCSRACAAAADDEDGLR